MTLNLIKNTPEFINLEIQQYLAKNPNTLYTNNMIHYHLNYYSYYVSHYDSCIKNSVNSSVFIIKIHYNELLYYLLKPRIEILIKVCNYNDYIVCNRFKTIFLVHLLKKFYNKKAKNNLYKWLFYKKSIDYIINEI